MKEPIALKRLVGENIRSLRKARGLSQEELGERAALSYKFVGEVERGAVNPSLESLEGIANALEIEVASLFLRDDSIVLSGDDLSKAQSAMTALNTIMGGARSRNA